MTAKQRAQGALSRALDEAAAPGRRSIIDALTGDTVCTCGRGGAQPRKWFRNGHDTARGFFCDDCEVAVDLARRQLKAGQVTKAWQTLERAAS